jgi:uncharacterized membrane protein YkgB
MKKINYESFGYTLSVVGVAIVLLWIGIFKFSPTEATGIEVYVKNNFLISWMYKIADLQEVSNVIGLLEIITGVGLVLHFFWKPAGIIAGLFSSITFLITLTFIFTTPKVNAIVDGFPVTDFFVLKDLMALGISLMVFGKSISYK